MRFVADENFNNDLLRALLRRKPELDIVRAQDTEISGAADPELLAWAAKAGRILLTHDVRTIPGYANARVRAGLVMSGVVEVDDERGIGAVLEDLLILIEASRDDEWEGQVKFVPIR